MKKSLTKLLARMAKDGDVETVAEFIEEMIGEETPAEAIAEAAAVEAVAETEEPAVVEAPEAKEITIDEDSLAGIIERLDRLINLLSPAASAEDDDLEEVPAEEIAEIVEEVVEAAAAESDFSDPAAEEIAEIVESILEPDVSTTLEETEGDGECEDPEPIGNDALRAALKTAEPVLAGMSRKQRRKASADIAARVRAARRKGANRGYDSTCHARGQKDSVDSYKALGKRIMAARNPNYRK